MVLKRLFGKKDELEKSTAQSPVAESASSQNHESEAAELPNGSESQDTNPGEPAPAVHLEQAMLENARGDTPESRSKVYQELLFSDLLLTLADPEPNAEGVSEPDAPKDPNSLSVAILTNSAGVPFAAAFTSAAAARRWRPEGGNYVSVRGQDIYKLLEPSPAEVIVINAGSAPFIVLPKIEYRQLAMGVVPQTGRSPVQVASGENAEPSAQQQGEAAPGDDAGQVQLAFPPDVFNADQKAVAERIMQQDGRVEAAVLGAILPPNADKNGGWVRTIFLRVTGVQETQDAMQAMCVEIRKGIVESNEDLFKDVGFEVGVMPDPNFWVHMHQNGIILFDRNPPPVPPPEAGSEAKT